MNPQKFHDEWAMEQDRQSRIDAQLAVMPAHQKTRLETEQRELELALARVYGNRLHEEIAKRIVASMTLDPQCLCTIGGGVRELPNDRTGWDAYARQQAEQEPLAVLSVNAADAALKESIRQAARDALPAARRMAMARSGELDDHLEAVVRDTLRDQAGV